MEEKGAVGVRETGDSSKDFNLEHSMDWLTSGEASYIVRTCNSYSCDSKENGETGDVNNVKKGMTSNCF